MKYNFAAARQRQQEHIAMYRQAKRSGTLDPELEFEIMALIEEIDIEISAVHKSVNAKMTVGKDGHSVMHLENVCMPIVTQWDRAINQN